MTIEKALSKLQSAQICHPNAVQHLIEEAVEALAQQAPIDMVLHCPACGLQHIDEAARDLRDDYAVIEGIAELSPGYAPWTNPPHRSHLCLGCKHIWRPADVPTNGVKAVLTKGENDSPIKEMKP